MFMTNTDLINENFTQVGIIQNQKFSSTYATLSCVVWAFVVGNNVRYLGETEKDLIKKINTLINWNNPNGKNYMRFHNFIMRHNNIEVWAKQLNSKNAIEREKSILKNHYNFKNNLD